MADLKPGWKRVKFGDMVTSAGATRKARGWTAKEAGVDRYVGLEHLDSNSLKIRRWGSPEAVGENSDLRHFEPGDVLLARRGIELRKVGQADFSGVASGHALVFRARPDVVLPEFLGFFMQSDAFMQRADRFSVGSLSHTVNLSALTKEEFALPPLKEQRRIASLAMNASSVVERYRELVGITELALQSALKHLFASGGARCSLADLCEDPITYGIVQAGPHVPDGVPYVRVSDMTGVSRLSLDRMLRTSKAIAERYHRSQLATGDIVVALRGVGGHCHLVPPELDGANLTQGTARVRVGRHHNSEYVLWALRSPEGRREFRKYLRGWKGESLLEITLGDLRGVLIPVVSRKQQDAAAFTMAMLASAVEDAHARVVQAQTFTREILRSAAGQVS